MTERSAVHQALDDDDWQDVLAREVDPRSIADWGKPEDAPRPLVAPPAAPPQETMPRRALKRPRWDYRPGVDGPS